MFSFKDVYLAVLLRFAALTSIWIDLTKHVKNISVMFHPKILTENYIHNKGN